MPVPSFNWSAERLGNRSLTLLTFDVDGDVPARRTLVLSDGDGDVLTWRTLVESDTTVQGHGDILYPSAGIEWKPAVQVRSSVIASSGSTW